MISLEMRPSPRLVQQIATIEHFRGIWERISLSEAVASEQLSAYAIKSGSESALSLDSSSPVGTQNLDSSKNKEILNNTNDLAKNPATINTSLHALQLYIEAHQHDFELSLEGIFKLQQFIIGVSPTENPIEPERIFYRTNPIFFTSPNGRLSTEEIVFPTISGFLIEQRFSELVEWARRELDSKAFHPLFIIGTFQLLFLQIHPFPKANHRLILLLVWHLLVSNGYDFVRYCHFAPAIQQRNKYYFTSLRQAEKTAGSNWTTLNIWLEFFLDTIIYSVQHLKLQAEKTITEARLTQTQQRIIEIIKAGGSVSREKIVSETGISLSTVKYNLSLLASGGHVKRAGGGRATSYSII